MLRAHRHWKRISTYERPGAWVRRATINLSLSAAKRASAELRRILRIADSPTLPEPDVADDRIWKAVAKLPGKQRAAIALHYLEDRPIDEIAASSRSRTQRRESISTVADRRWHPLLVLRRSPHERARYPYGISPSQG
jgi:DNA-directed RNA polymerase specialized sigma24 family protein